MKMRTDLLRIIQTQNNSIIDLLIAIILLISALLLTYISWIIHLMKFRRIWGINIDLLKKYITMVEELGKLLTEHKKE